MATRATLFFDLDGTLTDPREGIVRCIQHALERLGRSRPSEDELVRYIGPPLAASFGELLETTDRARQQAAVELYRERFRDVGIFENQVYPGIPESLAGLEALGHRLYVVSSKPSVYVERIVEHFALARHFVGIHGSELSGVRTDKAELIAHVLETRGIDASDSVMIGDRRHDVEGGLANGLRTLGVTWGYGGEAELREAGAVDVIDAPEELVAWANGASMEDR